MTNKYEVTYFYLASGMEGNADTRDYGVIEAETPEQAKEIVIASSFTDESQSVKEWFRIGLSAKLVGSEAKQTATEANPNIDIVKQAATYTARALLAEINKDTPLNDKQNTAVGDVMYTMLTKQAGMAQEKNYAINALTESLSDSIDTVAKYRSKATDMAVQLEDCTKQLAEANKHLKSRLMQDAPVFEGTINASAIQVAWNDPRFNPVVPKNEIKTYWVAIKVTHRPRNETPVEKIVVFPAQYVNKPLELDGDGQPTNDECLINIDGEAVDAVGWHTDRDHEEFDNFYPPLPFSENYVLLGWAYYQVPEFTNIDSPATPNHVAPEGSTHFANHWSTPSFYKQTATQLFIHNQHFNKWVEVDCISSVMLRPISELNGDVCKK